MTGEEGDAARLLQRYLASSRWENEGFSSPPDRPKAAGADEQWGDAPILSNTELVRIRVRVIALENLVIALLAGASDGQREVAAEMAAFISPRPGFTPHPMTLHAADRMASLVDRSRQFVCRGSAA